jgi:hypothetical protein
MRIIENEEKINKLCCCFSLLEEKDQEHVFSILQALLFAKLYWACPQYEDAKNKLENITNK